MKTTQRLACKFFCVLASSFLMASGLQAGGFGGPAAFRNDSPLNSGTDGVYQAVATATNLTGIFTFTIQNGVQTATESNNGWVFFIDGDLLSGNTAANISDGQVAGVLDAGFGTSVPTNDDGSVVLPLVFIVPGNAASGYFDGPIDLNSPVAAFSGDGVLQGTPPRVDQIVFISQDDFGNGTVEVVPVTIPGSTFEQTSFQFRGTRLTTSGSTTTTTSGTN